MTLDLLCGQIKKKPMIELFHVRDYQLSVKALCIAVFFVSLCLNPKTLCVKKKTRNIFRNERQVYLSFRDILFKGAIVGAKVMVVKLPNLTICWT